MRDHFWLGYRDTRERNRGQTGGTPFSQFAHSLKKPVNVPSVPMLFPAVTL